MGLSQSALAARFRERATWALPEGFHADVEVQDDGASAVANHK
jgi:hypothetical protein